MPPKKLIQIKKKIETIVKKESKLETKIPIKEIIVNADDFDDLPDEHIFEKKDDIKPQKPLIDKSKIKIQEPIIKDDEDDEDDVDDVDDVDDEEDDDSKKNLDYVVEGVKKVNPNPNPIPKPVNKDDTKLKDTKHQEIKQIKLSGKTIDSKTKTPLESTHQHAKPKKLTASKNIESSFDMFGDDDVDYRYVTMNYDYTKNITMPKITKYERALLIGKRAKQIEEGANPNVKVLPGQGAIEIAEEELRQRKIPLIIKRPNGNKFEYWKPADMEVFMD